MYAMGDDRNPFSESLDTLADLVVTFIADLTRAAAAVSLPTAVVQPPIPVVKGSDASRSLMVHPSRPIAIPPAPVLTVESVLWAVRRDRVKSARIRQLMAARQELRHARCAFRLRRSCPPPTTAGTTAAAGSGAAGGRASLGTKRPHPASTSLTRRLGHSHSVSR